MSYPPVTYGPEPVEVVIPPPTLQNRLTIFFRILLVIPQFILLGFFGIAAFVAVIIAWFAALVLGRLPAGLDRFIGTYVQYTLRVNAYLYFLTGVWPPFDATTPRYPVHVIRGPQPLNRWAVLFRLFLALPAGVVWGALGSGLGLMGFVAWVSAVVLGRLPLPFHLGFSAILRFQTRFMAYGMLLTPTYPWGLFGDRDASYAAPGPVWPPAPASAGEVAEPWAVVPGGAGAAPITRLVLTPGAMVVVALALAAGVFGGWGQFAFGFGSAGGSLGSAVSGIELSVDYSSVSAAVKTWDSQVQACESNNDLPCAQRASKTLADDFGRFGDQIGSLHFPSAAQADAAALRQFAYQAQAELNAMASSADGPSFLLAARSFAATAGDIDARYRATQQDLGRRF